MVTTALMILLSGSVTWPASCKTQTFDGDSEHVGLLFAAHAAVAMSGAQQQEHMTKAMAACDLIGQAKGILMERHKLTADQAFSVLTRQASRPIPRSSTSPAP
jgi:hypothetical protein